MVTEAANGQEAVEKYRIFRPDLVTMDITMPVLDGISALQQIRTIDGNACVVMISALGQEIKIIEAMNQGARHFIVKPFKETEVINKIGSILEDKAEEQVNAFASK